MSEFIFEQDPKKIESSIEYYCLIGTEDFLDQNNNPRTIENNDKTLARKTIRDDGSIRYSIKLSKDKKLFNPLSVYGEEKRYNLYMNNPQITKFKDVNFKCFEHYLNFIKTKNISYLYNAEREVL